MVKFYFSVKLSKPGKHALPALGVEIGCVLVFIGSTLFSDQIKSVFTLLDNKALLQQRDY